MTFRLPALALGAMIGFAGFAAQAAPVATAYSTFNDAFAALGTATEIAVAQGRIGNNATSGTYEIGLHTPPNFTNAAPLGTAGQLAWGNGVGHAFTLTRTGDALRFVLAGYDQTYTASAVAGIDALIIRTQATATSSITLSNLVLDDAAPGSLSPANIVQGAGNSGLLISGIAGDFTLTGTVTMGWTTTNPPNGSNIAFQIKAYDTPDVAVPAPAAMALFGMALLGLAAVRRRA